MSSKSISKNTDRMARGGVRRYLASVNPTDYVPPFDDIDLGEVSLTGLADFYGTDKGSIKHRYTEAYSTIINDLAKTVGRKKAALVVTEIGVACGASLRMWSDYLPSSKIYGYDVRAECANLCKDRPTIEIRIDDLTIRAPQHNSSLIIDDGSHISEDIVAAFYHCWPTISPGGYYVVEDLSCTYSDEHARRCERLFGRRVQNSRESITQFLDVIMKSVDHREDIAEFRYLPQLLILKKRN